MISNQILQSTIEGLKTMTDICFNKAFNLKNKLVDKKYLQDAINVLK